MTSSSPSHRRKTARRRAVIGGLSALGITGAAVVTTTLLAPAGAASALPAWPQANGSKPVPASIEVSGSYDGKLQRFYGTGELGSDGQDEDQPPVFVLKDGAVLKNVIIGSPAADGVHCLGSCTLQNVWWENVGEDAATFKGTSASSVYAVYGGGAKSASDKVFQFNGAGKLVVTKFQVADFGKLVRSCGNCKKQYPRTILVNDVDITTPGKSIVGVNANYGDTASLRNVRVHGDTKKKIKPCTRFTGNNTGKEPTEIGTGPDGTTCRYAATDITYD
ncbi:MULTISPECIES: pectate lyase [Streptomyces]|uniref:Pectate lyase n=1 Tax=Streptomyces venezuelae (strain ATCC 10712 / CBS 650.69 / DSM 40230 / JCM 4526 / NBRC 13096 / PD 04745) TaxID=953739 RepID=F2R0Z1_STRVP|nr:pectate lyase [Streptomyces venezuelae]APE21475.1 pectate lyase [Streptomyces venezuelae]QER98863.1 pectate lyase [Streptomyces venezuelae ATCC 10712]CCA55508.1 pectate lyase [Streptomyces venezuelae ATCC 10712]